MLIYILEIYSDEHKWRGECDSYYFTNKKALIKTLLKFSDYIGQIYSRWHGINTTKEIINEYAKRDFMYFDSEFARIERITPNEY